LDAARSKTKQTAWEDDVQIDTRMRPGGKSSQVWVKVAIGAGTLLALALLAQTVTTYFFVYHKIVGDEAAREAGRKEAALSLAAAAAKIGSADRLDPLVKQFQLEFPKQIAWIRVLDMDAKVIAQAGEAQTKVPSAKQLHRLLQNHQAQRVTLKSGPREVLMMLTRTRFFDPVHRTGDPRSWPPPPPPVFEEMAIFVDSVTIDFGGLRQNLIVGCLASVALLASMVLIAILFNRYTRDRHLEQQVELARSVQTDLLPSASANSSERVKFAAAFLPAATVGGDFYDLFTADDGSVSVVLGDVAGKGISAALLMGVLHGSIRSMSWTRTPAGHEEAARRLNQFLCEKTARERFASLFMGFFTPGSGPGEQGTLCYVNAGHLPPLLVRAGGKHSVERLETGGPVLGLLPAATYECGTALVHADDVLVIFSDGVAEATDRQDEEFGDARIAEIVRRHIDETPQQICDAVLREVNRFLGDLKAHDDQTLLVVRLAPAWKAESKDQVRVGEFVSS
jgi:serine phosphatase RsbU (regulator of sigma subunit)